MSTDESERRTGGGGSIGLLGATAIGIGGMVGGGIFAVLGVASEQAGGATPIAFAVAGAVAALTAVSYSRLSVRFKSAGGTVTFIDKVFGIGELTGSLNIVLWAGYIVTTALYASAFGNFAATLFPGGTDPNPLLLRGLIAFGVIIPWVINLANAGLVARSESFVVAVKLAMLMVVIAAGAGAVGCVASLAIVVARSITEDPIAMVVLVVLLISALAAEHLVLKRRRLSLTAAQAREEGLR